VTGQVIVIRGDALHIPLRDETVDLVVTSPPYFALRAYGTGHEMEVGSEATPHAYLEALWAVTRELKRVLKPGGVIWINLGDKYSERTGGKHRSGDGYVGRGEQAGTAPQTRGPMEKSLLGLPWRYAIGCIDQLGLILRRDLIWHKPSALPESVTDRPRSSHEYWFMLTKQPRYYSAIDELRTPPNSARRADFTTPRRPALGPERPTTIRTDDGPAIARGWCKLGSLKAAVGAAVAGDAERFQVVRTVGFLMRVETPERDYVIDLDSIGAPAPDAPMAVALKDALLQLAPTGATVGFIPTTPTGVLLSGMVTDDAWRRAEVLRLECVPVATEGLAARITLDLHPGRATLLVWTAFRSSHDGILPQINTLGALPGSVWSVPSEPLRLPPWIDTQHYAAFPTEWPRRLILGFTPNGICTACGTGRVPVVDRQTEVLREGTYPTRTQDARVTGGGDAFMRETRKRTEATILGYACQCTPHTNHPERRGKDFHAGTDRAVQGMNDGNGGERFRRYQEELANPRGPVVEYHLAGWTPPPTRPAIVLDPFSGTGCTIHVARALGRIGVGLDLSAAYCRLATDRTLQAQRAAKVLGRRNQELQGVLAW
jgi:DNA modification methylase